MGLCKAVWADPATFKPWAGANWGTTPQVQALAQSLATEFNLPPDWTLQQIASAQRLPQVRQLVLPPTGAKSIQWASYRARFIEPRRIAAGVKFWRLHRADLQRAEQRYGVPAQVVAGIIGVETAFGQNQGKFSVLNVLTTLSLDFPPEHPRATARQAFFRGELGHFLAQSNQGAALHRTGSYAGAMGWPQFMPSSWSKHAIDFNEDGRIDLNGPSDSIGSVANYLASYGWKPGIPTHYRAVFSGTEQQLETLTELDIVPTFSAQRMTELGVKLESLGQSYDGPLALVKLQNGVAEPIFVAGTENFYVITRYNWSSYYALAVIELGQAIYQAVSQP